MMFSTRNCKSECPNENCSLFLNIDNSASNYLIPVAFFPSRALQRVIDVVSLQTIKSLKMLKFLLLEVSTSSITTKFCKIFNHNHHCEPNLQKMRRSLIDVAQSFGVCFL